jgi:hypothetical protein
VARFRISEPCSSAGLGERIFQLGTVIGLHEQREQRRIGQQRPGAILPTPMLRRQNQRSPGSRNIVFAQRPSSVTERKPTEQMLRIVMQWRFGLDLRELLFASLAVTGAQEADGLVIGRDTPRTFHRLYVVMATRKKADRCAQMHIRRIVLQRSECLIPMSELRYCDCPQSFSARHPGCTAVQ